MRVDLDSFEEQYRAADDPWQFATSPYEIDKYDTTVASLSADHYSRCFEPACSIGSLTERLAVRADAVVACDTSPTAIARASERVAMHDNVQLVAAAIPGWWPDGTFDLIVLSELGYYWDLTGWRDLIDRCRQSLRPSGEIIAVHWLGSSPDHILHGTTVHQELLAQLGPSDLHLERRRGEGDAAESADGPDSDGFVLDRWTGVGDG